MSGIPKNGLRKSHLFKYVLIQKLKGQTRRVRPAYVYTMYYIYIYIYIYIIYIV